MISAIYKVHFSGDRVLLPVMEANASAAKGPGSGWAWPRETLEKPLSPLSPLSPPVSFLPFLLFLFTPFKTPQCGTTLT
jgi:hypothetical protein